MSIDTAGRVEVKHAVPDAIAMQVLDWSRAFLGPDRGVPGLQRVTSLYLDSPELTFYQWHRQRRTHRFKLRIRGYGEQPGDRVFAEVKENAGYVRRKSRAEIPVGALAAFLTSPDVAPIDGACDARDEFVARSRAYGARPTLLVSCLREALRETGAAGEVAVTADRRIMCQPAGRADLVAPSHAWRSLALPVGEGGQAITIVELKYPARPPAWMATLLHHLAPYRVSFSKYAEAVRQQERWNQVA
jgi:hypothetical protein